MVGGKLHVPFALESRIRTNLLFPRQKKATSIQKQTWWPHRPGSLLCSSAGKQGGWCSCPTPGVISWLAGEGRNGILQVRQYSFGKKLFLSLGTQLHLVKLLLVFISPRPVPNFSACDPWYCNIRMTHQAQRYLEMADSDGCKKELYSLIYLFFSWAGISRTAECFVWKFWFCFAVVEVQKVGK